MNEKIALGFCNCIDYEIKWNAEVYEGLIEKHGIHDADLKRVEKISTIRDLTIAILYSIKLNEGYEQKTENSDILEEFSEYFDKKITLGGTATRAALSLSKINKPSKLHILTLNDQVRKLLPSSVSYFCSNDKETHYPQLIIQYPENTTIKANDINIFSKRPNRLMFQNNFDRQQLQLAPSFFESLTGSESVLLMSGFNAVEDEQILDTRLNYMVSEFKKIYTKIPIFLESASYQNDRFKEKTFNALMPFASIFSLNEDEFQLYFDKKIDFLNPEEVKATLKEFKNKCNFKTVVLHSKDWAIVDSETPNDFKKALEAGVTMANSRFRLGDDMDQNDFEETKKLPVEDSLLAFTDQIMKNKNLICVPSYTIKKGKATVGLGDSFVGGFLSEV